MKYQDLEGRGLSTALRNRRSTGFVPSFPWSKSRNVIFPIAARASVAISRAHERIVRKWDPVFRSERCAYRKKEHRTR